MYACAQHVCSCGNEIYSDGDAGKLPSPQGNLEQNPTTVLDIQGVFVADFRVNKIPVGVKMLTGQDGEPALETVRVCARSRARLCMFVYVCVCVCLCLCVSHFQLTQRDLDNRSTVFWRTPLLAAARRV